MGLDYLAGKPTRCHWKPREWVAKTVQTDEQLFEKPQDGHVEESGGVVVGCLGKDRLVRWATVRRDTHGTGKEGPFPSWWPTLERRGRMCFQHSI